MTSKRLRRRLLSLPPSRAVVGLAARATRLGRGALLVAMFHRTLSSDLFGEQLDALLEGCNPVSGLDVASALRGESVLPPAALWITFDDAYADFESRAWPVLEARGLSATMFVPTAFVGSDRKFWWERLEAAFRSTPRRDDLRSSSEALDGLPLRTAGHRNQAYRRARVAVKNLPHAEALALVEELVGQLGEAELADDVGVLDWEALRRLAAAGLELGGHTREHPMLDQVPPDVARREVLEGMDDLRREVGEPLNAFAYPSGRYTEGVVRVLRESGLDCAVTTVTGTERWAGIDPFRIRRVPVGPFADGTAVRLRRAMAQSRWVGRRPLPDAAV